MHQQGARTDQTHVSPDHIEQLRQLVEAGPAEKPTETGYPISVRKHKAIFVACIGHGAEFIQQEGPSFFPRPLLPEKNGGSQHDADSERDDRHDRNNQDRPRKRQQKVKKPFPVYIIDKGLSALQPFAP